jgi:hypothetical protein
VEDSYKGPCMEGDDSSGYRVTLPFVEAMMEEFREQRLVHRRFAFEIVIQVGGAWAAAAAAVAGGRWQVAGGRWQVAAVAAAAAEGARCGRAWQLAQPRGWQCCTAAARGSTDA